MTNFLSAPATLLALLASSSSSPCRALASRPIAIVTGGTRGIGSGISRVLAEDGHDLLLTYNSNREAAEVFAGALRDEIRGDLRVECVGGDISLCSTRDEVFEVLDSMMAENSNDDENDKKRLAVLVHNAGQYVGITSDNSDGIKAGGKPLMFGDGSLLDEDGRTDFSTMHYYQRMYGEAFVDLCERSLLRMGDAGTGGGTIVGISSPGVCAHYYGPDPSYSMPGSGKSLMEYSTRVYAAKVAERGINVNVIIPGFTRTEAWGRLARSMGMEDEGPMYEGLVERNAPMKRGTTPRDLGNAVKFLCSESGRFLTGTVVPLDGGVHLKM